MCRIFLVIILVLLMVVGLVVSMTKYVNIVTGFWRIRKLSVISVVVDFTSNVCLTMELCGRCLFGIVTIVNRL